MKALFLFCSAGVCEMCHSIVRNHVPYTDLTLLPSSYWPWQGLDYSIFKGPFQHKPFCDTKIQTGDQRPNDA